MCFDDDNFDFVQILMNASTVPAHISVRIPLEISAANVLMATGYWIMA